MKPKNMTVPKVLGFWGCFCVIYFNSFLIYCEHKDRGVEGLCFILSFEIHAINIKIKDVIGATDNSVIVYDKK